MHRKKILKALLINPSERFFCHLLGLYTLPAPHYLWFVSQVRLFQASVPLDRECCLPRIPFSYLHVFFLNSYSSFKTQLIFTCARLWEHKWGKMPFYFKAHMVLSMTVLIFQRSKMRLPDPTVCLGGRECGWVYRASHSLSPFSHPWLQGHLFQDTGLLNLLPPPRLASGTDR